MKIKLKVNAGDQKPGTRGNSRRCTIATAAKRQFGGSAVVGGSTAKIRGRSYDLGADARKVVTDHDAGNRVGSRTITLNGPPLRNPAEQAEARTARKQARVARKAKAAERAAAAEQARKQAAERPAARTRPRPAARQQPGEARRQPRAEDRPGREQARDGERARGDEETREQARVRRAQEAEARDRLRSAEQARAPQPRTAQPRVRVPGERSVPQPGAAARQPARAPQPRMPREQPRAIEPSRPAFRFLRNPFAARPEPERPPARAGAAIPAGRR